MYMPTEKLYTVQELCTTLGLTARTITDLLRANTIKGFKVFGKWVITHSDLVAYVTAQKSNK